MKKFYIFFFLFFINNSILASDLNNQKTLFFTGAAGFIGSNFLEYMFNKYPEYNFIILDNLTYAGNLENIPSNIRNSKRFEFFYGSVTNQYLVDLLMKRSQMVVHFAAESHVTNSIFEDSPFFETDVNGTRVMMRSLVRNKNNVERFVHISTSEVYGTAENEFMDENHPLNPRSPYAAAKAGADRLVYAYWCTYDIPALIIRPFNNYGPRQHLEKVIPAFITNIILDKPLFIHGDGSQVRDWIHVSDTCKAIDKALHISDFKKIKNQVINIGSSKKVSIAAIANKIIKYFNLSEEYLHFVKDRPGQVECHVANIEKAKKLLEWEPTSPFEKGLMDTIEWYKNNYEWWKRTVIIAPYLNNNFKNIIKRNICK